MDETLTLEDATAGAVVAWLEQLKRSAQEQQQQNPERRQTPIAAARRVDAHHLPLPVQERALQAAAIYAQPPGRNDPFGQVLVLALMEPLAGGSLRLQIAAVPEFPLVADEIRWHLMQSFRVAQQGPAGSGAGLLAALLRMAGVRRPGAPVLACNLWLEEQLAHTPPSERRRLLRPWLERYRAVRGCEPVDPVRSFRAAVAGCERRMRRRAQRQ